MNHEENNLFHYKEIRLYYFFRPESIFYNKGPHIILPKTYKKSVLLRNTQSSLYTQSANHYTC